MPRRLLAASAVAAALAFAGWSSAGPLPADRCARFADDPASGTVELTDDGLALTKARATPPSRISPRPS
jgi:hypothetical protein